MPRREGNDNSGAAVLDRPVSDTSAPTSDTVGDGEGTGTGASELSSMAEGALQQQTATAAADTATKAPKRNLDDAPDDEIVGVTVRVPNLLRKKIAETAVAQNTSVPQLLAHMVAEAYSFVLPAPERAPRTKKYDSPEERKNAQKRDQQRQRLLARKVLDAVEKGIINVDTAALIAEVDAELDASAAKAAEATATATASADATSESGADTATTTNSDDVQGTDSDS